jgi:hypothetical protein
MENIKKILSAASTPLTVSLGLIIGELKGAWDGFWHGSGKGGAKQLLLDGLQFLGDTLKASAHILEDAVLAVMALVAGKWNVAWTKIKDLVGTWFGWIKDAMKAKDTILGDGVDAVKAAPTSTGALCVTWTPTCCARPCATSCARATRTPTSSISSWSRKWTRSGWPPSAARGCHRPICAVPWAPACRPSTSFSRRRRGRHTSNTVPPSRAKATVAPRGPRTCRSGPPSEPACTHLSGPGSLVSAQAL